jgi:O-antigen/teichoic acid export membrane protein
MSTDNKFFISAASTLAASMIIMACGLVTGSLIARLLGAAGRGEFASIQLYGALFASICTSGLPAAVTYFTGVDAKNAGGYYLTGIVGAFLLAIPVSLGGFIAIPYLLDGQRPEVVSAARFYLLFIPLGILTAFSLASLQGQMKLPLWNLLRIIAAVFWLIPLSYMFFYGVNDSITASKIYLLFIFLIGFLCLIIVLRNLDGHIKVQMNLFQPLWTYGLPTSFATFTQQSNLRLDQIFIAAILPPQILGIYVVSIAWSAAHSPLIGAITYVIVPHMTRLNALAEQSSAICRITRTTIVINLVLTGVMLVVTPAAIQLLFGAQFKEVVPIAYILIAGSVFSNVKGVLAEGLRGMGRPEIVMRGELFGLAVSLILFPLLLYLNGLSGVAVASIMGHAVTFGFLLFKLQGNSGVSVKDLLFPRREDLAYLLSRMSDVLMHKK